MKVYATGEKPSRQPVFLMSVAPAATVRNREVPAHWVDDNNNPVQFNIEFKYGAAEVEDDIGQYLVDSELARRTRLILPRQLNDDELADLQLRQQEPHGG
jgi:hypothetical protein